MTNIGHYLFKASALKQTLILSGEVTPKVDVVCKDLSLMVVSCTEVPQTFNGVWVAYFPLDLNPKSPAVKNFLKQFRGIRNKLCLNLAFFFVWYYSCKYMYM